MKHWLIFISTLFLFTFCGTTQSSQQGGEEGVWLSTKPIQCLGNPWEKDWLAANDNDYSAYPIGDPRIIEVPEKAIITAFFARQEIDILDIESEPFDDDVMVCDACHCPQGYTLKINVSKEDAEKLSAEFGFSFIDTSYE